MVAQRQPTTSHIHNWKCVNLWLAKSKCPLMGWKSVLTLACLDVQASLLTIPFPAAQLLEKDPSEWESFWWLQKTNTVAIIGAAHAKHISARVEILVVGRHKQLLCALRLPAILLGGFLEKVICNPQMLKPAAYRYLSHLFPLSRNMV